MTGTQSRAVRTSSPDPLDIPSHNSPRFSQNEYHECPLVDLHREMLRRLLRVPLLRREEISEALRKDDEERGSNATTVETRRENTLFSQHIEYLYTAEFGMTVPAKQLINEKIVYWTLNTFFPTLQLFFESGLSCVIDGGALPDAYLGLDPDLHFKLTDCAHEEEGRVIKSILPRRYESSGIGLVIKEVAVTQRMSIALMQIHPRDAMRWAPLDSPAARITGERHTVVGIRLSGMDRMAYIWARSKRRTAPRIWGDVRIAGLQKDVPIPNIWSPERLSKPGAQRTVVVKDNLITRNGKGEQAEYFGSSCS